MSKLKIIRYTSKVLADGTCPIVLRITISGERRYITLPNFSCKADQWDNDNSRFNKNYPKFKLRNNVIKEWEDRADDLFERLITSNRLTFNEFERLFLNNQTQRKTVFEVYDEVIQMKYQINKIGTADSHKDAKSALSRFRKGKDLDFIDIDYTFLKKYETFLLSTLNSPNSASVYMRSLRSIYNEAIKNKYALQEHYPFGQKYKVSILKKATNKRALSEADIRKIISFDPNGNEGMINAKNYFIFSYCCMGMNFIDMAFLTKDDYYDGQIKYVRRKKEKKSYTITLLEPAIQIINFYRDKAGQYIFPILDDTVYKSEIQKYTRVNTVLKSYHRSLRKIGLSLGISKLTSYVARHSWANVMYNEKNESINVIQAALGHDEERTTRIYLKELQNQIVNNANKRLLENL